MEDSLEDSSTICATLCCLCRLTLAKDTRKKKRFHGRSCGNAKQTLQQISDVPLHLLAEIRDPSALICKDCEKILENISKLTKQLQNLRSQVLQNLQALNHRNEQARMARKRPISCSNIDNHTRNNPTVAHGVTEASTIIHRPPSNLSSNNSLVSDNMSGSEEQMTADAILSTAMVSPPLTVSVLM